MTIRFDKKVERVSKYVSGNRPEAILIYHIDAGTTVTATAKIIATTEDKAQKVEFRLDGLFSNMDGTEIEHGGESKRVDDSSTDFDAWFAVGGIRSLYLFVTNGSRYRYVNWSAEIELTIRRDDADYVPEYPRTQVSIVGMEEAKKLGWGGMSDGINYVLTPNIYQLLDYTVSTIHLVKELWIFRYTKSGYSDGLAFNARKRGINVPSTIWNNFYSYLAFSWATHTGDFGTGTWTFTNARLSYSGSTSGTGHMNGRFRNRIMSQSVTRFGVTFLWSRYDVLGWGNYPRV